MLRRHNLLLGAAAAAALVLGLARRRRRLSRRVLPPSPLATYKRLSTAGGQLRTGYTHLYARADGVDRSAARAFREACRSQRHAGQTSGYAPGHVQANFVALPEEHAFAFLKFCLQNPKACPLLAVTDPGDPCPRAVADGADLRSDIPTYCVWRYGEVAETVADVSSLWDGQMVGFLLGCSFSWEKLLQDAGLAPRHVEERRNVPMYRTDVPNAVVAPFGGHLVVSMRPYRPEQLADVAALTGRYPGAHGGPVHWGDPAALGLSYEQLARPHWGDAPTLRPGEVPVFWACGVTPQCALQGAGLPLAITHAPGHMFVCDLKDSELEVGAC